MFSVSLSYLMGNAYSNNVSNFIPGLQKWVFNRSRTLHKTSELKDDLARSIDDKTVIYTGELDLQDFDNILGYLRINPLFYHIKSKDIDFVTYHLPDLINEMDDMNYIVFKQDLLPTCVIVNQDMCRDNSTSVVIDTNKYFKGIYNHIFLLELCIEICLYFIL